MERRQKLLEGINVSSLLGLEIGPLCRPFVKRSDGRVIYVDHATTDDLRKKYANDPLVSVDDIVDVDAVWGLKTLKESVSETVDYVVASHVIEHVPDLVAWMDELRSVLSATGEVRLIIPDRRFTFDYLRQESRFSDVIYANFIKARRPHAQVVLDFCLNAAKVDGHQAWIGTIDSASLEHSHNLQQSLEVAGRAQNGSYEDVHCWVFTPISFCDLFAELVEKDVVQFECTMFHDTAPDTIEFFVGMRPSADRNASVKSWKLAASRARGFTKSSADEQELHNLKEALEKNKMVIEEIYRSTSWRVTGPLRWIKSLISLGQ